MSILIFLTLFISLILLIILAQIDLETRLLPNIYVFPFFLLGLIFHGLTGFAYDPPLEIFFGCLAGGGLLYIIRMISNHLYKKDTLGLGDVKLMGGAGIWLGIDYIFIALTIGAFLGILHGIIYSFAHKIKTGETLNLGKLAIPAGPGFIGGILLTAIFKFYWT